MCGRTTLTITPEDLEQTFGFPAPRGYRPRYNIAPSQNLLALSDPGSGVGFHEYRWGLVPFWADDMKIGNKLINARAESIAAKPAFREAFERRRCLIVVDGFYEWQASATGKRPHRIRTRSGEAFTIAGLWERWSRGSSLVESCTIVTTRANDMMSPLHDRMPAIIARGVRRKWLAPDASSDELTGLLRPYSGDDLIAYEVSRLVNDPANDDPECIEPFDSSARAGSHPVETLDENLSLFQAP